MSIQLIVNTQIRILRSIFVLLTEQLYFDLVLDEQVLGEEPVQVPGTENRHEQEEELLDLEQLIGLHLSLSQGYAQEALHLQGCSVDQVAL